MKLSLAPLDVAATPIMRWPTHNTNALQKNFFAAAEPGEMTPLA